ncbi:complex I subunit 5 family protein [Hespellia stercorisuis]|uniref:Hydrogenase-4 component B n=1 Tax=Hespellia stercorisuis DSM 15480 TaxID=1121950 RepID=A0A1M6HJY2_9FIRM|nr:proton-conducting transporter membrane subunit [Hespellia stercorisuis]SHJ22523.1 hydrogenase-4 component B [Hespellia stercorisuis DSM 15480]
MKSLFVIVVFYPMLGAILGYLIGRKSKEARNYFADFVVISEFCLMLLALVKLQGEELFLDEICGMGLHFAMNGFRGLYGLIAAFMWMMTMIFSREYFAHYRNRNRYYLFQLVTLGATVGVFLSASLYTTFLFFEIMSFTSYVWVAQDERKESLRAAETYLAVAVIGGMVLLMGLFLLYNEIGTLEIAELAQGCEASPHRTRLYVAGACILFGFAAKAGAFPLHIWLPKAHPVAPAPASALLSGILTKAGVLGILIVSCYMFYGDKPWGSMLLLFGVLTMFGGAVLAVFSVDLKRTLACSSMSQIGFILVGIAMQCLLGEENALAVHGTFLHMMNHSLIKLVLFMVAGVVFMNIHELNLNEIRGFGRHKPFLNLAFLMGALGISGMPLWNGYISKTLIHESIVEYGSSPEFVFVEWIFLISGGLTAAYMTKLYVALFVERNTDEKKQARYDAMSSSYMNAQSRFAIGVSALVLPVLGIFPTLTMDRLAQLSQGFMGLSEYGHHVHYFGWESVRGGLISLAIGVVVYLFVVRTFFMPRRNGVRVYADRWPAWMDLENLIYRPLIQYILPTVGQFVCRIGDSLVDTLVVVLRKTIYNDRKIPYRTGRLPKADVLFGTFMDWYAVRLRHRDQAVSYRRSLRRRKVERKESRLMIRRSLSYGMQMVGIGMLIVVGYLLLYRFAH